MSEKKKKLKLKAPNAMLILVIIVLASAIASYVVPAGLYDRVADPVSYTHLESRNPCDTH